MPRHKNFATWAGAVKDWNKHQAFHDELYGIPKKGSTFYDEVFELFYGEAPTNEVKSNVEPIVVDIIQKSKTIKGTNTDDYDAYRFIVKTRQQYVEKMKNPNLTNKEKGQLATIIEQLEAHEELLSKKLQAAPKVEPQVESGIPISDLAEYHNALAGRRPHAAIAYYENKYPQLKRNKVEPKAEAKVVNTVVPNVLEPKPEPKMSNVKARAGLYTGDIITLTEEEAALYKVYNALQRIRSKAINKHRVYDGHPEVDKANADVNKVQTELRALIKKRVGTTVRGI